MRPSLLAPFVLAAALLAAPSRAADGPANPIGLMLGGDGLATPKRHALAHDLGAVFFRPWDISLADWTGRHGETAAALAAGFRVILTVRNTGKGGPPPVPTQPPTDLAAYRKRLGEVLEVYRPEVLVIENEENSILFWSGTPEEYGAELKAAAAVAHAQGVKVTNGGLVSSLVAALVWDRYRARKQDAQAEDFLRRATTPEQYAQMQNPHGRERAEAAIARGKALLAADRVAGIDYVNFHWYGADPQALAEAVAFLEAETGLPAMTNEVGQHDEEPETVRKLLAKILELKLPYAIWYSVDRPDSRALQNGDGTLRPNGEAFRAFLRERFH